ncbi:hypothetical protein QP315_05620 [Actinotignum timonense]|nr:hypothetical protein [Actinotignum timonense]
MFRPSWKRSSVYVLIALFCFAWVFASHMAYSLAGAKMDDEWRGRYDILVTDNKAGEALYSSRDKAGMTLLEQNYAAQTLPELESRVCQVVCV